MQPIDHVYQTLYSELAQRALDAAFTSEFARDGRFIQMDSRGRRYWYFDTAGADGGKSRRYVGPVADDEITRRVEHFRDLKTDLRARRSIVSTLTREARLPRPQSYVGDVVEAMADAGFFRLRGILVGTVAFQCYPALLGLRMPGTALQTGDADFAQFHATSAQVSDAMPPILDVLRAIDDTFSAVPHLADGRASTRFVSLSGFSVEFLTPNTGSDDFTGQPAAMPALGGASAQPLRFLDFLIRDPVRAVLLHKAGVPVVVPAAERYAVHKLIVASRRRIDDDGTAKSRKDRMQAELLFDALREARQLDSLALAWTEAWSRGDAWRDALRASLRAVGDDAAQRMVAPLAVAAAKIGEPFADPLA